MWNYNAGSPVYFQDPKTPAYNPHSDQGGTKDSPTIKRTIKERLRGNAYDQATMQLANQVIPNDPSAIQNMGSQAQPMVNQAMGGMPSQNSLSTILQQLILHAMSNGGKR